MLAVVVEEVEALWSGRPRRAYICEPRVVFFRGARVFGADRIVVERRQAVVGPRRLWKSNFSAPRHRRDISLVDFHTARRIEDRFRAVFADVVAPQLRVPSERSARRFRKVLLEDDDLLVGDGGQGLGILP